MNNSNNLMAVLLVFLTVMMVVSGQSLWKYQLKKLENSDISIFKKYVIIGKTYTFWIGAFAYIFATIMWIYILSKFDFSLVHPLNCMGYILALIIGKYAFDEPVGLIRILGVIVIIIGVIIITRQ